MALVVVARLLLLVFASVRDARGESSAVHSNQDLGQKLADLQKLLHEDAAKLHDIGEARRLETKLKPSIYGNEPGMFFSDERAYTFV